MRLLVLSVLFVLAVAEKKDKKDDLSHGFRTEIDWVPFKDAIGVAKDLNKPIFFLIHKTWCGACKALRRQFNQDPKMGDFIEISKKFVMVNVEDDEEPEDAKYAPDGGYIPRILFLDTDAEPLKTNNEQKYRNNKYFYPLVPQIYDAMERALLEFEVEGEKEKAVPKEETKEEKKEDTKEEKEEEKAESAADGEEEEVEEVVEEVVEEDEPAEEKEEVKEEEKEEKKDKKEKEEAKDEL